MIKTRAEKFGEWVVRHRWLVIVVTVALVGFCAAGVRYLSFTNDSRIYFSRENPYLLALEELENTFNRENNLLFVLAPKGGDVFTPEVLEAVVWLSAECWRLPLSSRVSSLSNFQHSSAAGDDLQVLDLVPDGADLTPDRLQKVRDIALSEPLLVNRLVSPGGDVTGVDVLIVKPGKSIDETTEVAVAARKLAARFRELHPAIDLHLTGGVMIDSAFGEASREDMTTLVPAMYLVLLLLLAITLRSFTGTVAAFLVIVFAMAGAMGLTGWAGVALNPSTVNAPTIILTLAVADSVHLLISMFQFMRQGIARQQAVAASVGVNLGPVTMTSLTTAVGFLSMNFSDAPPFRELGNIVAAGVTLAWLCSVFFLPALMAVLPVKCRERQEMSASVRFCDGLADFVIRRRKALFYGLLSCSLLAMAGIFQIQLDDDFVEYFDHRYEFRQATDFAQERLTGFNVIEYSLSSAHPGGINDPGYLAVVDAFAEWYRTQPKVVHVLGVSDIMKRLNRNMHEDDPLFYRVPDSRELAAQYMLLYELSLPFGFDLNNIINVDRSSSRMVVRVRQMSSREIRETDERARAWLAAHAPPEMFTYGTGLSVMFAHISKRNIDSMLGASFGALGLISLLLVVVLKSFRMGMVSLIPNLTPALIAFGLWGYWVGEVGLVVSVLAAMTLGIVVDDTIHFLAKYLRARRGLGKTPEEAVRYAFHTVGTALWVTSVVLVAGFLILTLSGFKINADMGLMTALTIVMALVMDLLFLPILLLMIDSEGGTP